MIFLDCSNYIAYTDWGSNWWYCTLTLTFSEDFSSGMRMEFTWESNDSNNYLEVIDANMGWYGDCSTGSTYECRSIKSLYSQKAGDTVEINFWSTKKISAVSVGSETTPFCVTSS